VVLHSVTVAAVFAFHTAGRSYKAVLTVIASCNLSLHSQHLLIRISQYKADIACSESCFIAFSHTTTVCPSVAWQTHLHHHVQARHQMLMPCWCPAGQALSTQVTHSHRNGLEAAALLPDPDGQHHCWWAEALTSADHLRLSPW